MTRDFRTPADPQDFESLYSRPAQPPRDFRVTKDVGGTLVIFEFKDFTGIPNRESTVEYRAYFVPATMATLTEMGALSRREAAVRVGNLAASVSAVGRGEWIKLSSPDYAGKVGFYLAVGVNRPGVESEPTLAFPSPYGTS